MKPSRVLFGTALLGLVSGIGYAWTIFYYNLDLGIEGPVGIMLMSSVLFFGSYHLERKE